MAASAHLSTVTRTRLLTATKRTSVDHDITSGRLLYFGTRIAGKRNHRHDAHTSTLKLEAPANFGPQSATVRRGWPKCVDYASMVRHPGRLADVIVVVAEFIMSHAVATGKFGRSH